MTGRFVVKPQKQAKSRTLKMAELALVTTLAGASALACLRRSRRSGRWRGFRCSFRRRQGFGLREGTGLRHEVLFGGIDAVRMHQLFVLVLMCASAVALRTCVLLAYSGLLLASSRWASGPRGGGTGTSICRCIGTGRWHRHRQAAVQWAVAGVEQVGFGKPKSEKKRSSRFPFFRCSWAIPRLLNSDAKAKGGIERRGHPASKSQENLDFFSKRPADTRQARGAKPPRRRRGNARRAA